MKEFRDIISITAKGARLFLACSLIGAACGWFIAVRRPPAMQVTVSLAHAGTIEENKNPAYVYDGYYIVERGRLFGERLGHILRGPEFTSQIALITGDSARMVRAERLDAETYRVKFVFDGSVEDFSSVVEDLLGDSMRSFAYETGEYSDFGAFVSPPVPVPAMTAGMSAFIGFLGGMIGGFVLVWFRAYFSEKQT